MSEIIFLHVLSQSHMCINNVPLIIFGAPVLRLKSFSSIQLLSWTWHRSTHSMIVMCFCIFVNTNLALIDLVLLVHDFCSILTKLLERRLPNCTSFYIHIFSTILLGLYLIWSGKSASSYVILKEILPGTNTGMCVFWRVSILYSFYRILAYI